jgi:Transglutaminase-like superfamily
MLPLSMNGQDFSRIDSLAMNTPSLATHSPHDLAAYCQANAQSELEAVRFYFVWVARNIRYDMSAASISNADFDHQKQSPQYVFKSHKAICTGYSRLFEHLCRLSQIPVWYVAGYGKEPIRPDSIETHAWNVIKVNGEWAVLDATWASNTLESDSSNLTVEFERYFMSLPDFFQRGHLPYDPVFQLTAETITRQEFFKAHSAASSGDSEKPIGDFETILNRDFALDSLSFTISSHRRGLAFMPEDPNIVIKLRGALKEKQYWTTQKAQTVLLDFSKNADRNLETFSIYSLKEWSERLDKLTEPLQSAIDINKEIERLETKDEKIVEVKRIRQQIFDLIGYFSQSRKAVNVEIEKRK